MSEKTLIILTTSFPVGEHEPWLKTEVKFIPDNWRKVFIFCTTNTSEKSSAECPHAGLLPNSFIYKRRIRGFFNRHFLRALLIESLSLVQKKMFFKNIVNSISVILRAFEMAKWFSENYIINTEEYLLYSYWGNENTTMACFIKLLNKNVKIVCRVHGIDVYEERTRRKHIEFRTFQLANLNAIYSVSEAGANYLKNRYPEFNFKIHTSYLGISHPDSTKLNPIPKSGRLELITCTVIRNIKRLNLIVEILKTMKVPVRWTLAGDGTGMNELKNMCKLLPDNITVEFLGYLNSQQLLNIYETRPLHFYISVSSTEGLPVAMMESISFGVPVISTNVGGCAEIVNSITGILIQPDFKVKDFAKTLETLYSTYDYSMENRRKIQNEWNKKFNAETNYTLFYDQLLKIN